MQHIQQLAEAILTVSKRSWIDTARKTDELTESEFLVLDALAETGTVTVGEIREYVKLLPAQLSRVLRKLESAGLVTSAINREDRRKVNVTISDSGRHRHDRYREAKLSPILGALQRLTSNERAQFMDLIRKMSP